MSRRLFTACLGTETNSFSPIPTGLGLFAQTMLVRNGQFGTVSNLFALPLHLWRERAATRGWTVIEGVAAFAAPAGDTTRAAYETLRDEIVGGLRAALPVDAVMLNLHGAMIADGYPDAEGDLMAAVRAVVGPTVPIVGELDLHCHLTRLKVDSADALVIFKEYPHVDVRERAAEVFSLLERMLDDGLKPVMAMHDCRMLGFYPTTREPMLGIVQEMHRLEREPGILSVSLAHGFPWGDTPEVGTRVLVVTDNDPALAARTARALGDRIWAARDQMVPPLYSIDQAIDHVLGAAPNDKPFVLADTADNAGIGACGDSTFLLARLIERGVGGVALSPLWDPGATALAHDAGVGARLSMRIGGKLGPASGPPLDLSVRVMGLARNAVQPFGGAMAPLGDVAWLRVGVGSGANRDQPTDAESIDIVVNQSRIQSFDPACFSQAGIDPSRYRALVVKSTQHFHAGFAPIAREILYLSAPGTGSMNFESLPHTRVTQPLWPRVANPHAG
ncbi:MAG TPA: M81 family metallopeptidase [Burkholderiaceae bacterium]|jgi:microcystin degradation protein MlrC|nr:M81 family metallopeptidase [Burkholderiaceae bacterium]